MTRTLWSWFPLFGKKALKRVRVEKPITRGTKALDASSSEQKRNIVSTESKTFFSLERRDGLTFWLVRATHLNTLTFMSFRGNYSMVRETCIIIPVYVIIYLMRE